MEAEHHVNWSFEQEFVTLLKKSVIPYDPRFVLGLALSVVPTGLGSITPLSQR